MECGRSMENKSTSDLLNNSEILLLSRAPFLMGNADCPGLCGLKLRVENTVQGSQATMWGFILRCGRRGLVVEGIGSAKQNEGKSRASSLKSRCDQASTSRTKSYKEVT